MKVKELRAILDMCGDDDEVLVSVNLDELAANVPIVAHDVIENEVCLFVNMYGLTGEEFERVTKEAT